VDSQNEREVWLVYFGGLAGFLEQGSKTEPAAVFRRGPMIEA
jgi:hypothetical protein